MVEESLDLRLGSSRTLLTEMLNICYCKETALGRSTAGSTNVAVECSQESDTILEWIESDQDTEKKQTRSDGDHQREQSCQDAGLQRIICRLGPIHQPASLVMRYQSYFDQAHERLCYLNPPLLETIDRGVAHCACRGSGYISLDMALTE